MGIIIADSTNTAQRLVEDFDLDMAFGDDENCFTLTLPPIEAPPQKGYAYIDGTEYGGTIDSIKAVKSSSGGRILKCKGRTWHGILAGKVIVPPDGDSHLVVEGGAGYVLNQIVSRIGLTDTFDVAPGGSSIKYTFDRFTDAYSGLRKMCRANGLKLSIRVVDGRAILSASVIKDWSDEIDSDLVPFTIETIARRTNHLVCTGTGEMEERTIIHLYANAEGKVSQTQSLFGIDEIAARYDYSNADEEQLISDGTKKLRDMQSKGSINVTLPDGFDMDVGDLILARDNETGQTISAEVGKKIVKAKNGLVSISYSVGKASQSVSGASSSGAAESSGNGRSYTAGSGISITGNTISAEVSKGDVQNLQDAINHIAVAESDATQSTSGRMSAADKRKLDGIADAANKYVHPSYTPRALELYAVQVDQMGHVVNARKALKGDIISLGIPAQDTVYKLPAATKETLGGVKPDGKTITISPDGTITANTQGAASSFLAAHPPGTYIETNGLNPSTYGGTWEKAPSLGPFSWLRKA